MLACEHESSDIERDVRPRISIIAVASNTEDSTSIFRQVILTYVDAWFSAVLSECSKVLCFWWHTRHASDRHSGVESPLRRKFAHNRYSLINLMLSVTVAFRSLSQVWMAWFWSQKYHRTLDCVTQTGDSVENLLALHGLASCSVDSYSVCGVLAISVDEYLNDYTDSVGRRRTPVYLEIGCCLVAVSI